MKSVKEMWVAIEDTDTYEVSDFEAVTDETARYIIDGYKVDKHDATRFRLQDVECGRHIVYTGVIYKGGYGYNIWLARRKYVEK